ncbi:MAG: RNA 3'-phosphate cyclase [Armatimonadetes bacterium]|nr:RNA 3'-phosphate cyclase [Armatimonadota bacterium]
MIVLDGSRKSGSGTIVRTAAALAVLRGEALRIFNVRARRGNPGLRPQHLRALEAVAEVTGSRLEGATVGAREFTLIPSGRIRGGAFAWDIGTAGSTTMMAQTLLPVAAFAEGPGRFHLQGGLFQDFAPSVFHLKHALLPLLDRMGVAASVETLRPGYVPRGGGSICLEVRPAAGPLRPLALAGAGRVVRVWGIALASHLRERRVSDRMARRCADRLAAAGLEARIEPVDDRSAAQPGAALAVFAETDAGCILGADRAGAPGRPSEAIADQVARALLEDLSTGATVDRYLADQVVVYAAMADGDSEWVVPAVTDHVETVCWLVEELLGAGVDIEGRRLRIRGVAHQRP